MVLFVRHTETFTVSFIFTMRCLKILHFFWKQVHKQYISGYRDVFGFVKFCTFLPFIDATTTHCVGQHEIWVVNWKNYEETLIAVFMQTGALADRPWSSKPNAFYAGLHHRISELPSSLQLVASIRLITFLSFFLFFISSFNRFDG